jgi:hypothetical protein
MFVLLVGIGSALAGGMMGVDWVPFGRADQAWIAADQLTGTQVAEGDGLLRPPLTAWGGWVGAGHGVFASLDLARVATSVQTHDQEERTIRTGIRPGVDYRYYLRDRAPAKAIPYLQLGIYGVVPLAEETSDSASKSEQRVLDEQAEQDRSRIGGVGGRIGFGAEHQWDSGLVLGARYSVVYHRSRSLDEETLTVSSHLRSEAALVIGFTL